MADIFVSFSRLDQDRVKPIVDRLGSLGYSVWCDDHLRNGEAFVDEVESQLERAKAVLTVWSTNARNSTWVYAESARALDAGKLAQVRLDNIELPLPFNSTPAAELSTARSEWGPLEDALTRIVRNTAPAAEAPQLGALATPASTGMPRLIAIAIGATLAAYASALAAAENGVMAPEQFQVALLGMLGVGVICTALSAFRLLTVSRAGG